MICLDIDDKLKFRVKGTIKDAAGIDKPFEFSLLCHRRNAEEIQATLQDSEEKSIIDFVQEITIDWFGVKDGSGASLEFNETNLRALAKIPGLASLCLRTYLAEVGAKEKN